MNEHQMLEEFAAQLPNPELPPDMDLGKVEKREAKWAEVTKIIRSLRGFTQQGFYEALELRKKVSK